MKFSQRMQLSSILPGVMWCKWQHLERDHWSWPSKILPERWHYNL